MRFSAKLSGLFALTALIVPAIQQPGFSEETWFLQRPERSQGESRPVAMLIEQSQNQSKRRPIAIGVKRSRNQTPPETSLFPQEAIQPKTRLRGQPLRDESPAATASKPEKHRPVEPLQAEPGHETVEQQHRQSKQADGDTAPLLQVDGVLESGDAVFSDRDNLYDTYMFEAEAGQAVIIKLESNEFDTYLQLRDGEGELLAQNDDTDRSDTNSEIAVVLPETGTYLVVAATYDAAQQGTYQLRVTLTQPSDPVVRLFEADELNRWGRQLSDQANYAEALEYYERALAIRTEIGDRHGEGQSLNNIGGIYARLGQYPEALEYYERALAIRTEIGDRRGEGISLNNIGGIYSRLGDYLQALEYYERSLAIFTEIGDRRGEGESLNIIGLIHVNLGDYPEALKYYERSLAIRSEIGDSSGEATLLNNIGRIYERQGDYPEALDYYERSLAIHTEIGDRHGEGHSLNNIGSIYANLGNYPKALGYSERSLAVFTEIGDQRGEAVLLNNIGNIYDRLGNHPEALDYYERSLAIRTEIGDRHGEGYLFNNIGFIYANLGNYPKALGYSERSLAIFTEIGDRQGEAASLNNIGIIYESLGEPAKAIEHYQQSLAVLQTIGDRAHEAASLGNIGSILNEQNQPELAIVFLKQSVNVYESIRGQLGSLNADLQQSYTDSIAGTYRNLADLLLQENRILEAQRVLDLLKVQELDEYLSGVRSTAQTQTGVDLIDPERQLSNRVIGIGYELAQLRAMTYSDLSPEQQQRLTELFAEQQAIIKDFKGFIASPEIQALIAQLKTDIQEQDVLAELDEFINLQNNLRKLEQNAVLIYPLILPNRLELVLVTPFSEPARYPVDVAQADLNAQIVAFRQALADPGSNPQPIAKQLYDWLIAPMAEDLKAIGAETILYAPDGALRYIPLAALHDGENWLIEDFRINHITATSLQDFTLQPDPQPRVLAAAFSEGDFEITAGDRSFPFEGLPFAGREVTNLAQMFPNTTKLLNTAFSRQATEPIMDSHTIVHLATHAAFVPGAASESFILFGNGDSLTLQEIKADWQGRFNQVNLIVLSACDTGLGGASIGSGEEILGFGYLMQEAGAEAAIASLWQVSDGGTQALMDAFYLALKKGYNKAEALQLAQRALIEDDLTLVGGEQRSVVIEDTETGQPLALQGRLSHPYYWAPFILIGNGL